MIQTWTNPRVPKNNCLVLDTERLYVASVPVRDLPESAAMHDQVPDVILDGASTMIPLARVTGVRLGLKTNELHVAFLSGRQFKNDECLLTLASADDATAVFSTLQSRLGDGFRTGIDERNANVAFRALVIAAVTTLFMFSMAWAVDHSEASVVQPLRILLALATAALFTYRLTQASNPEIRGILTVTTLVCAALSLSTIIGTEAVLVLGSGSVLCSFLWLCAQLTQAEQLAVLRKLPTAIIDPDAPAPAPTEIVPWEEANTHADDLTAQGLSPVDEGEEDIGGDAPR